MSDTSRLVAIAASPSAARSLHWVSGTSLASNRSLHPFSTILGPGPKSLAKWRERKGAQVTVDLALRLRIWPHEPPQRIQTKTAKSRGAQDASSSAARSLRGGFLRFLRYFHSLGMLQGPYVPALPKRGKQREGVLQHRAEHCGRLRAQREAAEQIIHFVVPTSFITDIDDTLRPLCHYALDLRFN